MSAPDEIRAALAWTRNAACREYHFAQSLLRRLPEVFTALDAGKICRSKAWLFTELCAELTEEQAQVVAERLLSKAERLTSCSTGAGPTTVARRSLPTWSPAPPADQPTPDQPTPDDTPRPRAPDDSFVADGAPADAEPGTNDVGRAADAVAEDDSAETFAAETSVGNTSVADISVGGEAGEGARSGALGTRVGVELRVGLSTLLGLDRHPGEIPGWGAVTAETARALSAAQHRAEWRYAITDPDGRLILGGITRRRPSAPKGNGPDSGPGVGLASTDHERAPIRGGIVELHIPATLLADLAAHPETCGPWAVVISELAAQHHAFVTDTPRAAGRAGRQDPSARFAGAALRRHIQIRDWFCVYMGCRCSARQADLDHTLDHSRGGATTEANSGPLCRHARTRPRLGCRRLPRRRSASHPRRPDPRVTWLRPVSGEASSRPDRMRHFSTVAGNISEKPSNRIATKPVREYCPARSPSAKRI